MDVKLTAIKQKNNLHAIGTEVTGFISILSVTTEFILKCPPSPPLCPFTAERTVP